MLRSASRLFPASEVQEEELLALHSIYGCVNLVTEHYPLIARQLLIALAQADTRKKTMLKQLLPCHPPTYPCPSKCDLRRAESSSR
jgi:hypothetical protein